MTVMVSGSFADDKCWTSEVFCMREDAGYGLVEVLNEKTNHKQKKKDK